MVNRFLDWLKTNRRIPSNAFDELRCHYGGRLAPIVRALLSDEPQPKLEELRPLPVFASAIGPMMSQHVDLMRSLGYRYDHTEGMLRRFDRFLQGRPDLIGKPLPQLIDAWRQADTGCTVPMRLSSAAGSSRKRRLVLTPPLRLWLPILSCGGKYGHRVDVLIFIRRRK